MGISDGMIAAIVIIIVVAATAIALVIVYRRRNKEKINCLLESKTPPDDDTADGTVTGLTVINNRLFVLRHPSAETIQVYETTTFASQRAVLVPGLTDENPACKALTSCDFKNCLYVCDHKNVFKVELTTRTVKRWRVKGSPTGLSVNARHNVIVTCGMSNEIREYTTSGSQVRLITLNANVIWPWHAVPLAHNLFVVSHFELEQGVSLVDNERNIKEAKINSGKNRYWNDLRHLAVTNNGSIFVTDRCHDRIVVLDSSLTETQIICDKLSGPRCLHFNDSYNRLFVGNSDGHVLVFDIVENVFQLHKEL
jgi:DNA-binding beta-propeller fold protein YncE